MEREGIAGQFDPAPKEIVISKTSVSLNFLCSNRIWRRYPTYPKGSSILHWKIQPILNLETISLPAGRKVQTSGWRATKRNGRKAFLEINKWSGQETRWSEEVINKDKWPEYHCCFHWLGLAWIIGMILSTDSALTYLNSAYSGKFSGT